MSDDAEDIERFREALTRIATNPCLDPEGNAEIAQRALDGLPPEE